MKIEIRKTEFITPDLADPDYCEVYITRIMLQIVEVDPYNRGLKMYIVK